MIVLLLACTDAQWAETMVAKTTFCHLARIADIERIPQAQPFFPFRQTPLGTIQLGYRPVATISR